MTHVVMEVQSLIIPTGLDILSEINVMAVEVDAIRAMEEDVKAVCINLAPGKYI